MNLREVYRLARDGGTDTAAQRLLDQQDWYAAIADFDPRTGEALSLGLDTVLHRLANRDEDGYTRDRLWRLVEHSRDSVERLFDSLSEAPRRAQAVLPIRDVKELNATSFIALSRRPGRNVREKLAGKPYMQAVRRYQSVDLPQNRLLKEYATQLAELLEVRATYLEQEDPLLGDIQRWLRSEDAQAIAQWDHLPPNNTLLSHRDYRRVWDSWKWLQSLDDDTARDLSQVDSRAATVETWEGYARAYSDRQTLFGDMPVLFEYDTFTIEPWRAPCTRATPSVDRPDRGRPPVTPPACVDLAYLRPQFATTGTSAPTTLPEAYLWQRWTGGHDSIDLELFDADMALLHADATSVTCADLFFAADADPSLLDRAAHAFTRRLGTAFANPALIWLVPDFVNDFQLLTARRAINARFSAAEPLPRSIAATFDQVDFARVEKVGFRVVVVDKLGGTTYATQLIARHDAALQERVPETRGFCWERSPHVVLQHDPTDHDPLAEIPRIRSDGSWSDAAPVVGRRRVSAEALRRHPQIGDFDVCITVPESPVLGGIRLHELQARAGDIPLWRDHIPELSIRVIKDGRRQPFYLVPANTRIRPLRGAAVQIPVRETFTLRHGQPHYEFPLFQGDSASELSYEALLQSPNFPLAADTVCSLDLTYTYGADDPYRLRFRPVDDSFPAVTATWRPMSERAPVDLASLPVPPFPEANDWRELEHWPRSQPDARTGSTESNLLEWVTTSLQTLNPALQRQREEERVNALVLTRLEQALGERVAGSFQWGRRDKNGRYYCRVDVDGQSIFCHESNFVEHVDESTLTQGDSVYLTVDRRRDNPSGRLVSYTAWNPPALEERIRSAHAPATPAPAFNYGRARTTLFNARFPTYTIWRHGRSIWESGCPEAFRQAVMTGISDALRLLDDAATPRDLRDELFFLLCRLHVDSPVAVQDQLIRAVEGPQLSRRMEAPVAYALGACSQAWQQQILDRVVASEYPSEPWILSIALWRSPEPVARLTSAQVRSLLPRLHAELGAQVSALRKGGGAHRLSIALELLLALLRTRASADPELTRLLSPDSEYGRLLTEQIDTITDEVVERRVDLPSRVELRLDKPVEFSPIPDLLYALRLYLTGDDGASAVRITSVADE